MAKRAANKKAKASSTAARKPAKKTARKRKRGTLDEIWTKEFKKLVAAQRLAARGRAAQEKAKTIRDAIVIAMGTNTECRLTDGRVICRVPQKRHLPPLPAKTLRWEQVKEIDD